MDGNQGDHGILLTTSIGDQIAIKAGFSSGYGGEGPRGFSYVLQLLDSHSVEIDECEIGEAQMDRFHLSALTAKDLEGIVSAKPKRPTRWHDYVSEEDFEMGHAGTLWLNMPPVIPFAIIDPRLMDLALSFWSGPDDKLLKGYRRWEDIVRVRTGLKEHGAKLASKAFGVADAPLHWENLSESEKIGRVNMMSGIIMTYRNARAHTEVRVPSDEALSELLMLNSLFRMERTAALQLGQP